MPNLEKMLSMRDTVAVAGVGDTDYRSDYIRARDEEPWQDAYGYGAQAFQRALDDCGLARSDIDGLISGPTVANERVGEILGINPRWASQADAVNALMQAVLAIHSGMAECIALVYGNDQKTARTAYGGPGAMGGERYLAYVYYAPWGFTSQGALYAMMANRYMHETGFTSRDLGELVAGQRKFAQLNPNAIMNRPLSVEDYLASKVICEPLRLNDYCLINDGGVALIVTTAERARKLGKPAVLVSGMGRSDLNTDATSLRPRLMEFYRSGHLQAAEQAYAMAGLGPEDMSFLQIYDSFSIHVPFALEGFGFCKPGEAGAFARSGATGPGGRLPVNTSGGHLSESYMQGWNHQVELVRQLRGEAGARQVNGARNAQYISDVAGKVATMIFRRDGA